MFRFCSAGQHGERRRTSAQRSRPRRRTSVRILLIDDAEPIRATVGEMLAHFDPEVRIDEARDGDEALLRYRECGPYDIVVTDYDHPGLNGYLLAEAIRKQNPSQPIACLTGDDEAGKALWENLKIPGGIDVTGTSQIVGRHRWYPAAFGIYLHDCPNHFGSKFFRLIC